MPDFHCLIIIVKNVISGVFGAQKIFSRFGQYGFIFLSFSLNNEKIHTRFPLLDSYCKNSYVGCFLGPKQTFSICCQNGSFSFYSPNNKKIHTRFPLLNSHCKNVISEVVWAQVQIFYFLRGLLHFLCFSPNNKQKINARFPLLNSYCNKCDFEVFGAQRKIFDF